MTSSLQGPRFLSRRRFLQRTLHGVAGWALWHGWPSQHRALAQQGAPAGQITWAMHITLAPTWFDPAETGALLTPREAPSAVGALWHHALFHRRLGGVRAAS